MNEGTAYPSPHHPHTVGDDLLTDLKEWSAKFASDPSIPAPAMSRDEAMRLADAEMLKTSEEEFVLSMRGHATFTPALWRLTQAYWDAESPEELMETLQTVLARRPDLAD